MNQMEFTILGQSYLLGCPEGGEALLRSAVVTVDREMSAIRDAGKVKARERMAVLAALNLAYQLAERPAPAAIPERQHMPESGDDTRIDQLIARIDAVMNEDGQLL